MLGWLRRLLGYREPAPSTPPALPVGPTPISPIAPKPQSTPAPSKRDHVLASRPNLDRGLLRKTIVFLDVETTGLHSRDRIVSLGMVRLRVALDPLGDIQLQMGLLHLIFDPGLKSHPEAERVHGYDDWSLRHQDQFAEHADQIAGMLAEADLVCAHNMEFDWPFIERSFADLGREPPSRPRFCTMQAARRSGRFQRARLGSVAAELGYQQGTVHSAVEDALLAMAVYLRVEFDLNAGPELLQQAFPPSNLRDTPPRPEVLPRRRRRKSPKVSSDPDA